MLLQPAPFPVVMTHGHPHCSDCINLLCNGTLWERGIEWRREMEGENEIFIPSSLKVFH